MRPKALRTVAWMTGAALMLSQSCSGIAGEAAAEPKVIAEEEEAFAEIPSDLAEESIEIDEESAEELEEFAEITVETAESAKEPVEIIEESAENSEESIESAEESIEITEEPEEITEEPEATLEESEEVVEEPAEITEGPAEITEKPAEIAEGPAEITEGPAEITEKPAEIPEEPTEITEESADLSEESAEITEGPTEIPAESEETIEGPGEVIKDPEKSMEDPEEALEEPEETADDSGETTEEFVETGEYPGEVSEGSEEIVEETMEEILPAEPENISSEILTEEIPGLPEETVPETPENGEGPGAAEKITEETVQVKSSEEVTKTEMSEITGKEAALEETSEEAVKAEEQENTAGTEESERIPEDAMSETSPGEWEKEQTQDKVPAISAIVIGEPEFPLTGAMKESGGQGENTVRLGLSLEEAALKSDSVQVYVESTNKTVEDSLRIRQTENESGEGCMISLEGIPEDQSGDGIYLVTVLAADQQGNLISSRKEIRINRYGSVYELISDEQPSQDSPGDSGPAFVQAKDSECQEDRGMKEEHSEQNTQYLPLTISERNVDEIVSSKIYYSRNGEELQQCAPESVRISSSKTSDGWMEYQYQIDRKVFAEDGCYEIQLLSCDSSGNRNCYGSGGESIRFTVDHSAPEVLVTGPEDGAFYEDEIWTCIEVRDGCKLKEVSVYLDGIKKQTCSGEQMEQQDCLMKLKMEGSGQWTTLQIKAEDAAGNITLSRPISFLLSKEEHSVV